VWKNGLHIAFQLPRRVSLRSTNHWSACPTYLSNGRQFYSSRVNAGIQWGWHWYTNDNITDRLAVQACDIKAIISAIISDCLWGNSSLLAGRDLCALQALKIINMTASRMHVRIRIHSGWFQLRLRIVVKCGKYSPVKFANFVYICITHKKNKHFCAESGSFYRT
jgi:hypothetical protein